MGLVDLVKQVKVKHHLTNDFLWEYSTTMVPGTGDSLFLPGANSVMLVTTVMHDLVTEEVILFVMSADEFNNSVNTGPVE